MPSWRESVGRRRSASTSSTREPIPAAAADWEPRAGASANRRAQFGAAGAQTLPVLSTAPIDEATLEEAARTFAIEVLPLP